jgi:hypothetical protein
MAGGQATSISISQTSYRNGCVDEVSLWRSSFFKRLQKCVAAFGAAKARSATAKPENSVLIASTYVTYLENYQKFYSVHWRSQIIKNKPSVPPSRRARQRDRGHISDLQQPKE